MNAETWRPPFGLVVGFILIFSTVVGCTTEQGSPFIYTVSPDSQSQNGEATIHGRDFGSSNEGAFVSVGGFCAVIVEWSDTRIRIIVPTGVGLGNVVVVVVVDGKASNVKSIFVTGSNLPASPATNLCTVPDPKPVDDVPDISLDVDPDTDQGDCTPGLKRRCGDSIGECKPGQQVCGDDGKWGECVGQTLPATEICDGRDNDCDGEVDEGCPCKSGQTQACVAGMGECAFGRQECLAGKWGPCVGPAPGPEVCDDKDNDCDGVIDNGVKNSCGTCGQLPAEVCDGKDNDCDGKIDEGCTCNDGEEQKCGSDIGACKAGKQVCTNGSWSLCFGEITPTPEVCDGSDNNCDGITDEGCECQFPAKERCGIDVGACQFGERLCQPNGIWGPCAGAITPELEICNDGIDNDCDGEIDEQCFCKPGSVRVCGTDVGECKSGKQVCGENGDYGPCTGEIGPTNESCDGLDNNCDGKIDEGCQCNDGQKQQCGSDIGLCKKGVQVCQNGNWGPCLNGVEPKDEVCDGQDNNCNGEVDEGVLNSCGTCGPLPKEICDGQDNDCDGQIDEDCICIPGTVQPCGTNVGVCTIGKQPCLDDGTWGDCQGSIGPSPEICDTLDNNCDGRVDEGVTNACGTCGAVPPEVCDGKDNDCDGQVDEGCKCKPGDGRLCGFELGECKLGKQSCDANGTWGPCLGGVMPSPEVCDTKDNNCDGKIDEGVTNACGTCGPVPLEICDGADNDCDGLVDEGCSCKPGEQQKCGSDEGICEKGNQRCLQAGVWGPCIGGVTPKPEVCGDNADNNCNGETDEGCLCKPGAKRKCGKDVGECRSGTQVCNNTGTWSPCIGETFPQPEICDGRDNDCDGIVDNNCQCKPGEKRTCGSDVGECLPGTMICGADGKFGPCLGETPPQKEVCDGKDNNCNGVVDEGVKNLCGTCGPAPKEICDGLDNNCDGVIDEGCACKSGETRSCGTNVGQCEFGKQICDPNGIWGKCQGGVLPKPEICDKRDNNCNGQTDEGVTNVCGTCGPPPAEVCDGKDNDCDGTVDEGCACKQGQVRLCGSSEGLCVQGQQFCGLDGQWSACIGGISPVPEVCDGQDNNCNGLTDEGVLNRCGKCGPEPPELCDGQDNDCDGVIDEGCECKNGDSRQCGTDVGLCKPGKQYCQGDGTWSGCLGGVQPVAEVCDKQDNNCDGKIDEGVTNACGTCGPVPQEVCDGKDNDCDGQIDEGCQCIPGQQQQCGPPAVGECRRGVRVCDKLGQWSVCTGVVGPSPEICDGKDNNCDGRTDENLLNACGTCGPPPGEVCDGKDNDCDGQIDEGCPCSFGQARPCGSNVGLCSPGIQVCVGSSWGNCLGGTGPTPEFCDGQDNNCNGKIDEGLTNACGTCGPPPQEICDGLDNNCNGRVDEGCPCKPGETQLCGTDVGLCVAGKQLCNQNGRWGQCQGSTQPKTEVCDGEDNDCDGKTDEGVLNACGQCGPTPKEVCDGKDNDCDRGVDEGCSCSFLDFRLCGTNTGACSPGVQVCIGGNWPECTGGQGPVQEVCNDKVDNDCDGKVDEADCI